MSSKRLALHLPRLAAAALLPTFALCGDAPVTGVAVTLSNLPPGAVSLVAVLTLDGKPLSEQKFSDGLTGAGPQLAFTFPTGTRGSVGMELLAEDANGCLLGRAVQSVALADDIRYDVPAALTQDFPKPQIDSVSVGTLLNDKDTSLIITGENLYPCAAVQVAGVNAQSAMYAPPKVITVTVPAHPGVCGAASLSVTNPGGQVASRNDLLTYQPATVKFGALTPITTNYVPNELLLADVNKDGNLDVVIASGNGGGGSQPPQVFLGNGTGGFPSSQSLASPPTLNLTFGLAVGDLNQDGLLDVVYTAQTGGGLFPPYSLITTLQVGPGQFGTPKVQGLPQYASGNAIADVDGDGKPDVVNLSAAYSGASSASISILLGKGDGSFTIPTDTSINKLAGNLQANPALVLADYNRDGAVDTLVGPGYQAFTKSVGMQVAANDGKGGLQPVAATNACDTGGASATFVTGDFNNDQKLDVSTGSHLCLGNGAGMFTDTAMPSVSGPKAVAAADV